MSHATTPRWETMRTPETRAVENALRKVFQQADAYRYNSASIRVRVIDPRFEAKSAAQRDALVERVLKTLSERTQADIINLLTLAPNEIADSAKTLLVNEEFDDPSPSGL